MRKTCQKCGTESDVDDSPSAACPSCGVIFAKVEHISVAQRQAIRAAGRKRVALEYEAPEHPAGGAGKLMWALCLLGSLVGVGYMGFTFALARSAPQEAAGMAVAMAFAVIPYVLARAVQELRR